MILAAIALAGAAAAAAATPCALQAHSDDIRWIKANCRLLDRDHPAVVEAEGLLQRLVRQKGLPPVELLVPDAGREPHAAINRDRVIVLSKAALDRCAWQKGKRLPAAHAQANLAFLLAHELAHLQYRDYLEREPAEKDQRFFESYVKADASREQRADLAALLDVMVADLDPKPVLDGDLLSRWVTGDHGRTLSERVDKLKMMRRQIEQALPLFFAAFDFLATDRYDEIATLLDTFSTRTGYEGREILSDHAYALLQQAQGVWADCDRARAHHFVWPGAFDTGTRAQVRSGESDTKGCLAQGHFEPLLDEAKRLLDRAVKQDPTYVPALLNLATAHFLAGAPLLALGVAQQVPPTASTRERAALDAAAALAEYLYGVARPNLQMRGNAAGCLRELAQAHPNDLAIAYNLARILGELAREARAESPGPGAQPVATPDEARSAWQRVLDLAAPARLADAAREELRRLGADGSQVLPTDSSSCPALPSPASGGTPALGPPPAKQRFASGRPLKLRDGTVLLPYASRPGALPAWRAYARPASKHAPVAFFLVVEPLEPHVSLDDVRSAHGTPTAELPLADGRRVLRFALCKPPDQAEDGEIGYAYVVQDNLALERVTFYPHD